MENWRTGAVFRMKRGLESSGAEGYRFLGRRAKPDVGIKRVIEKLRRFWYQPVRLGRPFVFCRLMPQCVATKIS